MPEGTRASWVGVVGDGREPEGIRALKGEGERGEKRREKKEKKTGWGVPEGPPRVSWVGGGCLRAHPECPGWLGVPEGPPRVFWMGGGA